MRLKSAQGLINRDKFDDWQISLIHEKKIESSNQRVAERNQWELERVMEAGPSSVRDYMLKNLGLGIEERDEAERLVPRLPNPLTPAEMQRLPIYVEQELAKCLREVTPVQAADPAFWTLCHAIWIGNWMFEEDVGSAFMVGSRDRTSDQRARNFLRSVGGLKKVRGNVSVLEDCQISAAWWRCRIAEIASRAARDNGESLSCAEAHGVLWHNGVWKDNLARWSLKCVTVLCAPQALAAVVSVLFRHGLATKQGDAKRQVQAVMRAVARVSYNYSVHSMDWAQLVAAVEDGLAHSDQINMIHEADESE
ncbi:MAG: hypothetical protein F4138_00440 [Acidimicrobiia bacterium]|nr:hypothetical protein [Acidimicrobiia bacterium]MYC57772.1 hypothetical protein [Acidimicrobiia bacterium]MYG93455.1 hypothetical protein [Acidimicrobiia bacterium]MYI31321.1 hypothetical protein [Acidimicrobiia bacterium]